MTAKSGLPYSVVSVSYFESLRGFKELLAVSGFARRIVVKPLKLRIIAENALDYRRNPLNPMNRPDTEKSISRFSGFSGFLYGVTALQGGLDRFSAFACLIASNPLNPRRLCKNPLDYRRKLLNPLNRPDTEKQIARFSGFSEVLQEFIRFQGVLDSFSGFVYRIVVNPANYCWEPI